MKVGFRTPTFSTILVTSPATAVGSEWGHEAPRSSTPFSLTRHTPTLFNRRASRAPTIIPRSAAITRLDLVQSAERIWLRYLSPQGAGPGEESHEIYLPPALRIHSFPLSSTQEPRAPADQWLRRVATAASMRSIAASPCSTLPPYNECG